MPSRKEALDVSENERNTFIECNSQKYLNKVVFNENCYLN